MEQFRFYCYVFRQKLSSLHHSVAWGKFSSAWCWIHWNFKLSLSLINKHPALTISYFSQFSVVWMSTSATSQLYILFFSISPPTAYNWQHQPSNAEFLWASSIGLSTVFPFLFSQALKLPLEARLGERSAPWGSACHKSPPASLLPSRSAHFKTSKTCAYKWSHLQKHGRTLSNKPRQLLSLQFRQHIYVVEKEARIQPVARYRCCGAAASAG